MSKINLKTDYQDGNVLHGSELNVNNNVTMLGVNDNFDRIKSLSENKADITYVNNIVSKKADVSSLNNQIASLNLTKADKTALATKANQTEVDKKANISYVDSKLETKSDINYVNNELSNKANKDDVYTKNYIDNNIKSVLDTKASISSVNVALSTKVNIDDFNDEMNNKVDNDVVGNLYDLKTDDKSSIVNAVNSINTETKAIATTEKVGVVKPDGNTITIDQDGTIHSIGGGGGTGGTTDYNDLTNKPKINNVEIKDNVSLDSLGLMDRTSINTALSNKANKDDVYTKNYIDNNIVTSLNDKANTIDVNIALAGKADLEDLENKVDKSYVDSSLELKSDKTYVDSELDKKANTIDVYSKTTVDELFSGYNDAIDSKLLLKADSDNVYSKSEANNLVKTRANNLSFENNKLQLKSDGELIGDYVDIEVSTNDVIISNEEPASGNWKLWIDSGEIDNAGSEIYIGDKPNNEKLWIKTSNNIFDGLFELGDIDTTTGENNVNTSRVRTENFIPIEPNTVYTLSTNVADDRWGVFYDKNKNFLGKISLDITGSNTSKTFTSIRNAYYIRWYLVNSINVNVKEKLEKGKVATDYSKKFTLNVNINGKYEEIYI